MRGVAARIFLTGRIVLFRFVVSVMNRMLNMLALDPARFAEECQEDKTPAVETGQQCSASTRPEGERAELRAPRIGRFEDRIFGIEARKAENVENADTGNRERTGHHRPVCE